MRIDPSVPSLTPAGGSTPRPLAPGDRFSAEVVSADGEALTLKTSDGSLVSARSVTPLPVNPGDVLTLAVTDRQNDTLFVSLRQEGARDALQRLELPATAQNTRLMSALLDANLPAASIKTALSAMSAHAALTPEQAVWMMENDIPMTDKNISLLQQLERQELSLGAKLADLSALLGALPGEGEPATALPANTAAPNPAAGQAAPAEAAKGDAVSQPPAAALAASEAVVSDSVGQPNAGAPTVPTDANATPNAAQTTAPSAAATQSNPAGALPTPESVPVDGQTPALNQAAPNELNAETTAAQTAARPETQPGQTPAASTPAPAAPPLAPGALASEPTAAAIPAAQEAAVRQEPATPQFADTTAQTAAAQAGRTAPPLNRLQKLVSSLFVNLGRELGGDAAALEAGKLSRQLSDTLREVQREIAHLPASQQAGAGALLREISVGIQFASQMNHMAAYMQIPVRIGDHQTNAELYVFADEKGQKKIDPRNASIFVSLDTATLDRVETMIKVVGQQVETDFSLPSPEAVSMLSGQSERLLSLLGAQGYKLTRSAFHLKEQASGPVSVQKNMDRFTKRYRFDKTI